MRKIRLTPISMEWFLVKILLQCLSFMKLSPRVCFPVDFVEDNISDYRVKKPM